MTRKYLLALTPIVIIVLVASFCMYKLYIFNNFSKIQNKIVNSSHKIASDITYKQGDLQLSGTLTNSQNFKGGIDFQKTAHMDLIEVDNKSYVKSDSQTAWQTDANKNSEYSLNLILHPEYIQIQKRLSLSINGIQYQIIFEKPDQDILKQIPAEELTNMRLTGTIWVNPKNYQLKQMKLHQGKDTGNEIVIDYTLNPNPPEITAPKL